MKKKIISLFLAFSVVFVPFGASAESPPSPPLSPATGGGGAHFPCQKAFSLNGGEVAPCTGILWSNAMTVDALRCKKVDLPLCISQKAFDIQKRDLEIQAFSQKLEACDTALGEQSLLMDEAIDSAMPTPWYKSPYLWGTVGFVIGAGVAVGLTYAISPAL